MGERKCVYVFVRMPGPYVYIGQAAVEQYKKHVVFYRFSESRLPKVSVSRRRNVHLGKDVLLGVLRRRQGQSRKNTLLKVACAFCVSVVFV